ncbi:MAG: hypothetical protein H7Y20_12635 [Bryobacteraceae bacterium]|nr:hypothetical protein [Bryobacteraceae bacterium]
MRRNDFYPRRADVGRFGAGRAHSFDRGSSGHGGFHAGPGSALHSSAFSGFHRGGEARTSGFRGASSLGGIHPGSYGRGRRQFLWKKVIWSNLCEP